MLTYFSKTDPAMKSTEVLVLILVFLVVLEIRFKCECRSGSVSSRTLPQEIIELHPQYYRQRHCRYNYCLQRCRELSVQGSASIVET